MKRLGIALLLVVFCTIFVQPQSQPSSAVAETRIPRLVPFSGAATDISGKPLTGVVGITFSIYKDQLGGAPLWIETQNVLPTSAGRYTVTLGATKSDGVPADLFTSGKARWLGVQPQGQPEQPRVQLMSVPYAMKAVDAETVGGLPVSAFVLVAPSGISAGTPTSAGRTAGGAPNLAGTGTQYYVSLWMDNAGTLGNSVLYQSGTGSTAKVGINTTTPSSTLDVKGTGMIRGTLSLPATGTATATKGANSQALAFAASAFNSGTSTAVKQSFQWQAAPVGNNTANATGSLNLLFGRGSSKPSETGLNIASNGRITFAPGQTFPGTGNGTITGVTAGTDLSGGGASGNVTLNLDTTKVPQLATANTFIGTQTINGNVVTTATGTSLSASGGSTGVYGTGSTSGVAGSSSNAGVLGGSSSGIGVLGSSSSGIGVYGDSGSSSGYGVRGYNSSSSGSPVGVYGSTGSNNGYGVYGYSYSGRAVYGGSDLGYGVYGSASRGSGVYGTSNVNDGFGVWGNNTSSSGPLAVAVYGSSSSGFGVFGNGQLGVYGQGSDGVNGWSGSRSGHGVYGENDSPQGPAYGVYGYTVALDGWAGYFDGNLDVTGAIYAGTKDFKIDHPLDPANKYLVHASVESSEMMNIYTGNILLDGSGEAWVALPDYFEALNRDFRYQLTAIGAPGPNLYIAQKIKNNRFEIAGGTPGAEVSWQVTGIRRDAYAKAHPLITEVEKTGDEKGKYIHPVEHGQAKSMGIDESRRESRARMKPKLSQLQPN